MLPVIRKIVYADSGIRLQNVPSSQEQKSAAELVRDIVILELRGCVAQLEQRKIAETTELARKALFDLRRILEYLAPNERQLQRFVRHLNFRDVFRGEEIQNGLQSAAVVDKKFKKPMDVVPSLLSLGWTMEKIAEFTSRLEDPVKLARRIRADKFTQKMNSTTYSTYAEAKTTGKFSRVLVETKLLKPAQATGSGPVIAEPKKVSPLDVLLGSLGVKKSQVDPFVEDVFAYMAAEVIHLVVDMCLIYKKRGPSFLRDHLFSTTATPERETLVFQCLSEEFDSVISPEDITEITRILHDGNNSALPSASILRLL